MNQSDYAAYLQSPEWQRTRQRALRLAHRRCKICGNNEGLQVHHKAYDRLGDERDSDLIVLCRLCHKAAHGTPYYTFMICCKTCKNPGVDVSFPDRGWVRFICFNGHLTERKI